MSIEQPQLDVTLPDNLKRAIEDSRNLVTVNEAEVIRLKGIINSQNYTIIEKNKEEKELIQKIETLKTEYDLNIILSNNLDEAITQEKANLSELTIEIKTKTDNFKKVENDLAIREADLLEREQKAGEKSNQNDFKEQQLNTLEETLNKKHATISAFKESL